jgi:hypothetical protein
MADSSGILQQLQGLVGSDFSTEHLKQILQQIQGLGIKVQNQRRGDPRPRFLLPSGETWDFGPGGWVNRGNIGDWDAAEGGGGGGGGGGGMGGSAQQQGGTLGDIPGFQFALQQGILGAQRSDFAKGIGLTGGALKHIQMVGTGVADQFAQNQFANWLNQVKLGLPKPPA